MAKSPFDPLQRHAALVDHTGYSPWSPDDVIHILPFAFDCIGVEDHVRRRAAALKFEFRNEI